ncbi:MAG: flavodoxin family protein [Solobacterium sp.]|nr:flavodoxin family protein [Erysipelotrichaceae bacterium]MBQ1325526.1 flavodoxin family protein [Solobacterium sp.]MBQ2690316.1 flavodoxin family protein [Solobacterium sp.]MBQ6592311.1 flavodoxin family protein [Solobacterium sp.]MBR0479088.1 flavodoxin family protein [Solobacterium sp.]
MKATVVYVSKTGITASLAEKIAEGLTEGGVEAKAFSYHDIDMDWMTESKTVIIGTPTYYTDAAADTTAFLETLGKYGVAGKLGGAFATAQYAWGGNEMAMMNIIMHEMFFGMLVYSGGGAAGNPPIHIGPIKIGSADYDWDALAVDYGKRMAAETIKLFG